MTKTHSICYNREEKNSDEQRIVGTFTSENSVKTSRALNKAAQNPFVYPNIQCVLDLKDTI